MRMSTPPPGPEQLARTILGPALSVRRGENVLIESWGHTMPFASACVVEARRRGARPMLLYEDETAFWRSLEVAPPSQIGHVGTHEWAALAQADAYVFFPGPGDRPRFQRLPEREIQQLTQYNTEWYRRARAAKLRGVRSVLGYASDLDAARWGVDGPEWRAQLVRGSVEADLVAIKQEGARAAARLITGKELRVTASNGTDLTMRLRGRTPTTDDGVVDPADVRAGRNLTNHPPGSVVVAIDERSARGVVIADRPSFLRTGRVDGGQWEFERGRLVSFSYTDGQSVFESAASEAPPGWDHASLFSLGLNPALAAGVPQVEDQEEGAITIAVGGNAFYGGSNHNPFLSWVVVGEATVAVDGKPLVDRGKIL
jgi:leucyl aminopeptidase (aminopeptidase T)